jgi:hypothetical protein
MLFTPVKDDAHQMADKQWRCGCLIPGKPLRNTDASQPATLTS